MTEDRPSSLCAPAVVRGGEFCQHCDFLPPQQPSTGGGSGNFSRELGTDGEDRLKQQQ